MRRAEKLEIRAGRIRVRGPPEIKPKLDLAAASSVRVKVLPLREMASSRLNESSVTVLSNDAKTGSSMIFSPLAYTYQITL